MLWMAVFFIAMAYLESAVVVYLRALVGVPGSAMPVAPLSRDLVLTETFREVATLVMILAPAFMVARSGLVRFAWFCFGFAVWDLFYYIWLYVLISWPSSLFDPDLLFLLPIPWIGPVWAPCLISVGLIALAILLLQGSAVGPGSRPTGSTWALLIMGALVMLLSFVWLPWQASFGVADLHGGAAAKNAWIAAVLAGGDEAPDLFAWPWFLMGEGTAGAGIARLWMRLRGPTGPGNVNKV